MSADGGDGVVGPEDPADLGGSGPPDERPVSERVELTPAHEVAAAALNRAKAAAARRGLRPGAPAPRRWTDDGRTGAPGTPTEGSGPGPSRRDPAPLGDTVNALVDQWGWRTDLSVGGVIGRWREIVGDQVADHCRPETFDDGVLVLRADSTSWATQVRYLTPQLLGRLAEELGPDVVREVRVLGPSGPVWTRGPRRVPGRGPRDTYG